MYNAIYIDKQDDQYQCDLRALDDDVLPEGDVTVAISYSTLNFKDGLAISGTSPVVRKFPMVPGIDFAGTVIESTNDQFAVGDQVFTNGWGLGEKYWGGLAQKTRIPAKWLLATPESLSAYDVMAVGTGGYTAMLCVMALQRHGVTPESGPVLVTGANGGVGSFAVAFLSRLGYEVIASTGRMTEEPRLKALGAKTVIDRATLSEPGRPLNKEQWAGAIDTVGSHTLANVCASTCYGGTVAACGLAQGMDFPATVAPFILRGVTLAGIDSVMCPMPIRQSAWQQIEKLMNRELIEGATTLIPFNQAIDTANQLLAGQVTGRVIVDVNQ